jgi:hypothetical protein|tara:strand:- start:2546 stop:2905 length:360 start_codon:yes stop_codon:yes gene_type:complete
MLVSMNAQRLYEVVHYFAKNKNKYILVVDISDWMALDDTKKATVKTYYEDFIPVDEIGEVFANRYTFYEFDSQATAVETAGDWFPLSTDLSDMDYFVECYVMNPSGSQPYGNKVPANPG